MQHEILVALLGHSGSLIGPPLRDNDDDDDDSSNSSKGSTSRFRFQCSPLACSLLSQGEVAAVNRVVEYGGHVSFLNQFIDEQNQAEENHNDKNCPIWHKKSLYMRAISSAIQDILHMYEKSVCSLERSLSKDPSLGVGFIHGEMELKMRWIPWVTNMVVSIQNKLTEKDFDEALGPVSIGKVILETIHAHLQSCGDEHVRSVLQSIQSSCHQILLRQIGLWMERGQVVDPFKEFFIESKNEHNQYDAHHNLRDDYQHTMTENETKDKTFEFDNSDDSVILKSHRIPTSIISLLLANRILFIGKAVRVILKFDSNSDKLHYDKIENRKNHPIQTISDEVSHIFQQVVEMHSYSSMPLPLLQILQHSVDAIHTHVSQKLYQILMHPPLNKTSSCSITLNLLHHLQNIRKAFLLGDGQLFTALCEECDSSQLWTKYSPHDTDVNPMEFQMRALYPVMRRLYEWDGECIISHTHARSFKSDNDFSEDDTSGRLELAKRLSIVTFPKSFIFSDFSRITLPTLILGGMGARHVAKKGHIVLSSIPEKSSSSDGQDDFKRIAKMSEGFVFTRVKQEIAIGTKVSITFQLLPHFFNSDTDKEIEGKGFLSMVLVEKNPWESMMNALSNGSSTQIDSIRKPETDAIISSALIALAIKVMFIDDDNEKIRVTINDKGSKDIIKMTYPESLITMTAKIESDRIDVYVLVANPNESFDSDHQNFFPPEYFFGKLVASTDFPFLSKKKVIQAHVGVGAKLVVSKLLQWSLTCKEETDDMDDSTKLANELSLLSNDDTSSLLPSHQTRLTLKKVHESILRKIAWLDGGGASDEEKTSPLKLYYSLPWPFHLVIQSASIKIYNRIFNRMFAVQRASYEIHQCWKILLEDKYRVLPNSDRLWLAPLWAIRTKMEFFLSNLLQYWKLDVAGSAFHQLQISINSTNSFESVQAAHIQYLGTLRRRCFFDSVTITKSLKRSLTIVLRFTEVIRRVRSLGEIPSGEVNRLSKMFDRETVQLFMALEQSDALELCARLDFNGWYSSSCTRMNVSRRALG